MKILSATMLHRCAETLGITLTSQQYEQFRVFYDEVVLWNKRINLTSIVDFEEFQLRHFADSLSVSLAIPKELLDAGRIIDIGTGAGFPGIPLKIAFPGLHLSLLEATIKKAVFLTHIKDRLNLRNTDILNDRAETLAHDPKLREAFDIILARAVATMPELAELMLPFCRLQGLVIALKGSHAYEEAARANKAIETLGGRLVEVKDNRVGGKLVVIEKTAASPHLYPRRPGIPGKRPI